MRAGARGARDMIGNVWEWTAEWYAGAGQATLPTPGFGPYNAQNWGADYNGDCTHNVDGHVNITPSGAVGAGIGIPSAAMRGGYWTHGTRLRRSEPVHVKQLPPRRELQQAPLVRATLGPHHLRVQPAQRQGLPRVTERHGGDVRGAPGRRVAERDVEVTHAVLRSTAANSASTETDAPRSHLRGDGSVYEPL